MRVKHIAAPVKRLARKPSDEGATVRYWRGCIGKVCYPSKKNAAGKAKSFGDPSMAAYKCPLCGRWHIGHSKRRVTIVVMED